MKRKMSNYVVVAAITAIVTFWLAETILLLLGQTYPDTFITCWFAFWGVELTALASIKITKTRRARRQDGEPAE